MVNVNNSKHTLNLHIIILNNLATYKTYFFNSALHKKCQLKQCPTFLMSFVRHPNREYRFPIPCGMLTEAKNL